MKPLFDIDVATNSFTAANAEHYVCLIQSASNKELKLFRKQVVKHKNIIRSSTVYGRPALLEHWYIISAINHELLKRSWRYKVYRFFFPVRQWLVKIFSNKYLSEETDTGSRYDSIEPRLSVWHLSHNQLIKIIATFWCTHFKWIVTTLIAITVIYLRFIGKL